MKRKLLPILFLAGLAGLYAQDSAYLDIGNVKALIYSDANLFQDRGSFTASYEVPKDSNMYSIYASSFWMSSREKRNGKPLIASAYERFGNDFTFSVGPVDVVNQKKDTSAKFQRLWKIDKSEIDLHIKNWNTANYVVPASISDWPGNGNANTAKRLAPFADLDNDSIYEPLDGEYPIIKGDQAVFLMVNDYRPEDSLAWKVNGMDTTFEYYKPLKVEMHVMLFAFDTSQQSIRNTVFTNVKVYNRSNSTKDDHTDFRFSVYADFDLGSPFDDYIGSDTSRDMFYVYNGDSFDEPFRGLAGYGNKLAAQGVQFLDQKLAHSVFHNIGTAANGDPDLPSHIAAYQRSEWKNGQKVFFGGNGFNYCVDTSKQTRFMFVGDPALTLDTNQWTEENPCLSSTGTRNPPGDRRMIGGPYLPKQFNHGESIELNYAYVFSRTEDSAKHISDPVNSLKLVADSVQNFYSNIVLVSVDEIIPSKITFNLFPNPAKNNFRLKTDAKTFEVEIFNLASKQVLKVRNQKEIDISHLSNGIYFVRLYANDIIETKKLIVVD